MRIGADGRIVACLVELLWKVSFDLYRLRVAQPNQPNNRLGRRLAASLLCESLGQTSNLASSGPIDPDTNYINGLLCCVVLCCAFSGL